MEKTKFHELCMAYGQAQNDFQKFETDCHLFAIDMVKKFKEYLQVPDSQFSLYKITKENEFEIVPPALINAIKPAEGPYWQFGMGLMLCSMPESLPQDLILIHVLIRKDMENKYYAKFVPESKEFEIDRSDTNGFNGFFDFIHKNIVDSYNGEFQKFIGQTTARKLGYKIPEQ